MAGGFSRDAEKKDVFIRYPNGTSSKYHRWSNNKKVLDGSIIIMKEEEEEPFDRTEFAKELASILASLAQAVSVVMLAAK